VGGGCYEYCVPGAAVFGYRIALADAFTHAAADGLTHALSHSFPWRLSFG
jgi:hypothetical protein